MDFCRRHVGFGTKAGWQCKLVSLLSNPVIHSGADTGVILHILVTTMKEYKDRDETVFDSSSISRSCYLNMPSISGQVSNEEVSLARSRCSLASHPSSYSTNTSARL